MTPKRLPAVGLGVACPKWFLVLFPALVFMVFAWLVGTRRQKLYPPAGFRNEDMFRDLAYGRATFDQQMPRGSCLAARASLPHAPAPGLG